MSKQRKCINMMVGIIVCFVLGMISNRTIISHAQSNAIVRVGSYDSAFLYEKNGIYTGYGYEYLMNIAKYTGWKYEFVTGTYEECISWLKSGDIDLLGPMDLETKTSDFMITDKSIGGSCFVLVTLPESIDSLDTLSGKEEVKIGYLDNRQTRERLREYSQSSSINITVKAYSTIDNLWQALGNNTIQAVFIEEFDCPATYRVLDRVYGHEVGFAVTRSGVGQKAYLESALSKLQVEQKELCSSLYDRYYKPLKTVTFYMNPSEKEYVQEKRNITVLVPQNYAPFYSYDSKKEEVNGVLANIMQIIGERTGLGITYEYNHQAKSIGEINTENIDLVLGITSTYNNGLKHKFILSQPLIMDPLIIATNRTTKIDPTINMPKVAVVKNGAIYQPISGVGEVYYQTVEEAVKAVNKNQADMVYGNEAVITKIIRDDQLKEIVVRKYLEEDSSLYLGYVKENNKLMDIIDRAILSIDQEMINEWMLLQTLEANDSSIYRQYHRLLIGFLIFVVLFVIIFVTMLIIFITKIKTQKKIAKEAELEEERYRVAIELANDVIFEYNIQTDIMKNSEKYKDIFGRNPIIYNYTESLVDIENVHSEDQTVFEEYCGALHIGKSMMEYEFRLLNRLGEYEWCHIRCKTICNSEHLPVRVIGKIVNIDTQKRELEKLQFKAQRDPLTNVYNKGASKEKIDDILKNSKKYEKHALFVIDIDDFKHVNDAYGHLLGDRVLATIMSHVDGIFREADVVGRIGGDEFIALMRNVTSREQIVSKAAHLSAAFKNRYHHNNEEIVVSGSIGIAIYPMDGSSYEELLEHADMALYEVKGKGKNNFKLYGELDK